MLSIVINSLRDKSLRFLVIIMKNKYGKRGNRNHAPISVEIDYDKLANAIVKANRMVGTEELQPKPKGETKVKFFKGLWRLIKGDINTNEQMTLGLFSLILSFFFAVAIVGFIFALFVIGSLIVKNNKNGMGMQSNFKQYSFYRGYSIIFVYSVLNINYCIVCR